MADKKFECIRIEPDFTKVKTSWKALDMRKWVQYNKLHRTTNALFVDGFCVHKGCFDEDRLKTIEKELHEEKA